MSTLFQGHYVQFFDDNGVPLSGGTVDFYEPGTSTPKDVYTDSGLTTPAQNPLELDAAGRATVWLNGDYKVRLKNSAGVVEKTTDNVNPPAATETSSGNIIANGSFETQGNSATEASGWTLTAQSDGTVERITTDNNHGTACLKFTSDGSGGGQADTDAFFPVADSRNYEVSFALKCSVADIRNIVQVRYFDADQVFLSNSTVYDEDAANPTSWTLQNLTETPPAGARFAKLRILGADQSDSTAGEAKFDEVTVRTIRSDSVGQRFPNVNADVTSSDEELNKLDGYSGDIPTGGWILLDSQIASASSSLDFTTGLDSTYDRYLLWVYRLVRSDTAQLHARTSTDGGSTWDSGSSDYSTLRFAYNGGSSTSSSNSAMLLTDSATSSSALTGEIIVDALGGEGDASFDRPTFTTDLRLTSNRWGGVFARADTTAINAIQLFPSAGNFASGVVYLYGWKSGS